MTDANFVRAHFIEVGADNKPKGAPVAIHFNPVSLQYTLTNNLDPNAKDKTKQFINSSSAKLTMDLQFDTTHSGEDVRAATVKIARLMVPAKKTGTKAKSVPPRVRFEWGTYTFTGVIEAYKETIDFFAPIGVPLRASVNLTLSDQDTVFDSSAAGAGGTDQPVQVEPAANQSVTDIAAQGGDPNAARQMASDNALDSLRFPSGPLNVSAGISLRPPAAFASADIGASLSGGISGGLSAGVSGGLSAGISGGISGGFSAGGSGGISGGLSAGISGGVSGGLGIGLSGGVSGGISGGIGASASIGGTLSAGVSATSGAFAGLSVTSRTGSLSGSVGVDTSLLLPSIDASAFAADASADFDVTGKAQVQAEAGFRADVGANASVSGFLQFDE